MVPGRKGKPWGGGGKSTQVGVSFLCGGKGSETRLKVAYFDLMYAFESEMFSATVLYFCN